MPSTNVRDTEKFTNTWFERIDRAKKAKKRWEDDYEIPRCKEYWRGNQLEDPFDEFDQRKVQINKVHPTVRASIPTLYFHDPYAKVVASPALADTIGPAPGVSIDDRAQLIQDTVNTLIRDPSVGFDEVNHACLKEAHWSFGCVRVMYDAVPVENPNILAPPLKESESTPVGTGGGNGGVMKRLGSILGLNEAFTASPVVQSEKFYIKRIPSRQVLVAPDHTGVVRENPWIGYWSIHYLEDVKNSPLYTNTEDLKASGVKTNEDTEHPGSDAGSSPVSGSEKVILYNIWDQRTKTHFVFADGHKKPLLEEKYKRLPLMFLRFDVDPDSFYPIPPIYHELHPQDEFNDSREWLRKNRKGTVPRYTYDKEAIDPRDMRKLESGEMGTYIPREANTHGVIEPVQQPNYSVVATQTLALSKEEFTELSMVAGERKGVPQSKTATQAKIVDVRSQVTESYDRVTVAKFLSAVLQELVFLAVEKMTLNRWIIMNADPTAAGFPLDAKNIADMYKQISHTDLEDAISGLEWYITIEEGSMSPVALEQERQRWMQTLAFLENPIMTRLLAMSPQLRKRTLDLTDIKSGRDQDLIGQAFAAMVQMEMAMAAAGGPAPPGTPSAPKERAGPTPTPGPAGPGGPEGEAPPPEAVRGPGGARVPL